MTFRFTSVVIRYETECSPLKHGYDSRRAIILAEVPQVLFNLASQLD